MPIPPNAFIGRAVAPSDGDLTEALCSSRALWDLLVTQSIGSHGIDEQDWNSYSTKAGWTLRLRCKGRNIAYLTPSRGCFVASFALGDRAVEAVRQSVLPADIIALVNSSRRYVEGTAVRIEVRAVEDVAVVVELMAIKLAH